MSPFSFQPIGVIRTPFADKFGTPRQGHLAPSSPAHVEFAPHQPVEQWLRGLEGFSHVWLLSVFHHQPADAAPAVVRPPRLGGRAIGTLASRSPHRPNPIGLSLAKIDRCFEQTLLLSGVDLLDGTPLLDIKPYLPESDRAESATSGWVSENPWPALKVMITATAEERLDRIYGLAPPPLERRQFVRLIEEILATDPRAVVDRNKLIENEKPRRFWLRLYDVDVGFYFTQAQVVVDDARFAWRSPLYTQFEEERRYGQANQSAACSHLEDQ